MAQTILYYPEINIRDGVWLRNAILYWDEISSIVPYADYEELSPELLYLQDLGIYSPIYPQTLFFSDFAEDFYNSVFRRISFYDRSIIKDSTNNPNRLAQIHKNKIYAPALHELIHYKKLPQNIMSFLEDKRFINDCNSDGWMQIDSKIAQIYMRTLAEYSIKCSDKDIVLGTNTFTRNQEIYNRSRNSPNLRTQCCRINIEKCLPQPTLDTSYEEILAFKERRKDELRAFKSKIRELETNIYNADSIELIKHHEAQFIESWEQCSNDFYRVLKESQIAFSLKSMASLVAIPFVNQLLSQRLGTCASSVIQTGLPLLSIGIDYLDFKNKINPLKINGAFSYIIKANREGIIRL